MKPTILAITSLVLLSSFAVAQNQKLEVPGSTTQVLNEWVTNIEQLLVPAADAMPEAKYSFAPTAGEFKGVRTFAEQVKHLAAVNYILGANILGEKPPVELGGENGPDTITTKTHA